MSKLKSKLVTFLVIVAAAAGGTYHVMEMQGYKEQVSKLTSYKDEFPPKVAIAAHDPSTGWQVQLDCTKQFEPNKKYAIDMALTVWDKDFQSYRCNLIPNEDVPVQ